MAGGSADAAAALVALDRLWDLQTSDDDLLRLAAELGSDVPFALLGGTGARHRPRRARRAASRTPAPGGGWSSVGREGAVHAGGLPPLRRAQPGRRRPEPPGAGDLLEALASGDPGGWPRRCTTTSRTAALDLRPDLADLLDLGERDGALRGLVSGSGPTCVFLAETRRTRAASPAR